MAVRNEQTLEDAVAYLEKNGGDKVDACSRLGVSTGWLKKWMREDPKVEAAINDALDTGTAILESAAIKRAVKGVKEPIYYKDELVGHRRKFSDPLLIKLLESRKPDTYGKRMEVTNNVNVRQLDDAALDEKIELLSKRLGIAPPPLQIEDASFVEIDEFVSVDDLL